MFRLVQPGDPPELPMRILFHPVGDGVYLKACEADGVRGLVAALLNDPAYEAADPQSRLVERLRIANDIALLAELDGRRLEISDREGPETIVIASDEPLLYSLERLGFVSLSALRVKR
jgi:hypothetical protein